MKTKSKAGRPTSSPKYTQFSIRFDDLTLSILDDFCSLYEITRPDAVRYAVRFLKRSKSDGEINKDQ